MINILLGIGALIFGIAFAFILLMALHSIFCAIWDFIDSLRDGTWRNW